MGLDISRITSESLKDLAYTLDKDNNGQLNDKEITIFKRKAKNHQDFLRTMDELYVTNPTQAKSQEVVNTDTVVVKDDVVKAEKTEQEAIKNDIKALINGNKKARLSTDSSVSLENLVENLRKHNTNTKYESAITEVEEVVNFVKEKGYDSKDEVEALNKAISKNAGFNDFQKSLANDIVKLAEKDQINKEVKVLIGYYNDIRKNETNFTECLEKVEAKMILEGNDNKSYYSDEAFDILKEVVRQDVLNSNNEYRKTMIENGSENVTKKAVKKALLDEYQSDDKFARKIVKKDKVENARVGRWLDRDRTAEDLESISADELKKELGETLFGILDRSYLETVINDDGSYNLKGLSDKLFERVGFDVWMSLSDDTPMSELQGVKNELKVITGRDLSGKDVKKILKLVHIKKEQKDRNPLNALLGGIIPAIAGAITGAVTGAKVDATQRVVLNMDVASANELTKQLTAAGAEFTESAGVNGKIQIIIEQSVLINEKALAALAGAGIGVLTGALMNLILGMENNEESCVSIADFDLTDDRYTNSENYKNYIEDIQPEAKAKVIKALVDVFVAKYGEDNWAKEYDSMLKKFAGKGSVLNCLELQGGYLMNVTETTEVKEESETISIQQGVQDEIPESCEDVPIIDARTSSWAKLADQYECLGQISVDPATHPNCYRRRSQLAVRILKVAQAINDGNYSEERLLDLAEKTFASPNNKYEALRNYPGIDYAVLVGTMNAQLMGDVKMPKTLAGCDRVEKDIKATVKDKSGTIAAVAPVADRICTPGVKGKYGYRINGGAIIECTDKADLDKKVQEESEKARRANKVIIIEKLQYNDLENAVA